MSSATRYWRATHASCTPGRSSDGGTAVVILHQPPGVPDRDETTDPAVFRRTLGHFCTGVVVVTAVDNGDPVGMTCQSFSSLSLDPPLVMFSPAHTSTTWPRIRRVGFFAVNILAAD